MDRREILKYAAALTGAAICAPITLTMLSGCSTPSVAPNLASGSSLSAGQYFNKADFALLSQVMDTILPRTDTPSASDVGVHIIVDNMFDKVYEPDYQNKFMNLFTELRQYLGSFATLDDTTRLALLTALETLPSDARNNAYWAYIDIKQQSVAFYLSSQDIAENHLNYLPIPGQYKPCVPVNELNGKAWAI